MISCLPRRRSIHPVSGGIHGFCPSTSVLGLYVFIGARVLLTHSKTGVSNFI
jgi:hypothetical protein